MNSFRVQIVPRTGRYAPVRTVLVGADSLDEAYMTARARCATSKVISAEDVDDRRKTGLRLLAEAPMLRFLSM
jgi:hypothetical protein